MLGKGEKMIAMTPDLRRGETQKMEMSLTVIKNESERDKGR